MRSDRRSLIFMIPAVLATAGCFNLTIPARDSFGSNATDLWPTMLDSTVRIACYNKETPTYGWGTGFCVASDISIIQGEVKRIYFFMTAKHVIDFDHDKHLFKIHAKRWGSRGELRWNEVVSENECLKFQIYKSAIEDLAIVMVLSDVSLPVKPVMFGYNESRVGERVYAVGCPQQEEVLLKQGIVSVVIGNQVYVDMDSGKGASGSALFDENGRVVGLINMMHGSGNMIAVALGPILDFVHEKRRS